MAADPGPAAARRPAGVGRETPAAGGHGRRQAGPRRPAGLCPQRRLIPVPVNEFHRQVAAIVLRVAAEYGFAVGGGTALIAHGIVDRYTADLDLVSPRERAVEAAAARVEAALRAEGLQAERQDRTDGLVDEWPERGVQLGGLTPRCCGEDEIGRAHV